MKVYSAFASPQQRNTYVCRSDINRKLLSEFCLENVFTVSDVVEIFDDIRDVDKYIIVKTGSSKNLNLQRHTKFVKKGVLYNELCDSIGLPDSYRIRM